MPTVYKIFKLEHGVLTSCEVPEEYKIKYDHEGPWNCVFAFEDLWSAKAFVRAGEIIVCCDAEVVKPLEYILVGDFGNEKIRGLWEMAIRACVSKVEFLKVAGCVLLAKPPKGAVLCWNLYLPLNALLKKE